MTVTVTEKMIEAFKNKYREFWSGSWPDSETSRELISAALAAAEPGAVLTEAQEQAQAALDKVMNCRFSNFDAGAVIHWAERGLYQVKNSAALALPAAEVKPLAPVDVYRALKARADKGTFDVDHLSAISREIAALAAPSQAREG